MRAASSQYLPPSIHTTTQLKICYSHNHPLHLQLSQNRNDDSNTKIQIQIQCSKYWLKPCQFILFYTMNRYIIGRLFYHCHHQFTAKRSGWIKRLPNNSMRLWQSVLLVKWAVGIYIWLFFHLTFRRSVGLLDIEGWPIVVCSQGSCPLMAGVCIYKEVGRGLSLFVILTVAHNRMRRIFYSLERSLPIVISFSGGLEFSGEA